MTTEFIRGLRFASATLLLFGGAYPLVVWGAAQAVFHRQAQGSLVTRADGSMVGSMLIAQPFTRDGYFHPRPSGVNYNAAAAGGTNSGPTNPDHLAAVAARVADVRTRESLAVAAVPADLVTASGAGLDPHLSPAAIAVQVPRVAAARGISTETLTQLVTAHTERPTLGVLGRPRVNVLLLNLALDAAFPLRISALGPRSENGPYRRVSAPRARSENGPYRGSSGVPAPQDSPHD